MAKHEPITPGTRFGRLTALGFEEMRYKASGGRQLFQQCACDCGTVKFISIYCLARGTTQSCGCLHADRTSEESITHGLSKTRIYRIWSSMIVRCENPKAINYPRYGGRGIRVCERWHKFANFLEDMGIPSDDLSIDRIDNDGNYCKENCEWASASQQNKNRRPRKKKSENLTSA